MTKIVMPTTWKEFFIAVEQMRECQREYFRTKTMAAFAAAKTCESAVDDAIQQKRDEWARERQPELPEGGLA